jgi:cell division protein FtsN
MVAGEGKRAVVLYSDLLEESPGDPVIPIALAQRFRALDALGRKDEALADARRLVEKYPRSSEAAELRDRLRRQEREQAAQSAADAGASPQQKGQGAPGQGSRVPVVDAPSPRASGDASVPEKTPGENLYSLQLGAFGSESNAQDLARQLEQLKMPDVRIEKEPRGNRVFYRVRCGSYPDPETAEASGQKLAKAGLRYQVVVR